MQIKSRKTSRIAGNKKYNQQKWITKSISQRLCMKRKLRYSLVIYIFPI